MVLLGVCRLTGACPAIHGLVPAPPIRGCDGSGGSSCSGASWLRGTNGRGHRRSPGSCCAAVAVAGVVGFAHRPLGVELAHRRVTPRSLRRATDTSVRHQRPRIGLGQRARPVDPSRRIVTPRAIRWPLPAAVMGVGEILQAKLRRIKEDTTGQHGQVDDADRRPREAEVDGILVQAPEDTPAPRAATARHTRHEPLQAVHLAAACAWSPQRDSAPAHRGSDELGLGLVVGLGRWICDRGRWCGGMRAHRRTSVDTRSRHVTLHPQVSPGSRHRTADARRA
ncbi:hypothetical protein FHR75_004429 [Kineococcus radiotolerans]|uniref:Uncharacterized protein n=1 Tax=Kineococcus radiotolerans TaxID=131568 RepID=A0A7W4XYX3_KINRA|nr:hypothetical protein [Kineococcus radiotolerans]